MLGEHLGRLFSRLAVVAGAEDGHRLPLPPVHPWLDVDPEIRGFVIGWFKLIRQETGASLEGEKANQFEPALDAALDWLAAPGFVAPPPMVRIESGPDCNEAPPKGQPK